MKVCHRCQCPWEEPGQPGFNNLCRQCGMPLHACINCRHFVARGSIRCLVPQAEKVLDPRAANPCRHFDFAMASAASAAAPLPPGLVDADPRSARRRWEELFEKKP